MWLYRFSRFRLAAARLPSERGGAMSNILEGVVSVAAVSVYLAPSMIADVRNRSDSLAISLVNVLLGWTVVGWIAALMWARRTDNEDVSRVVASRRRSRARATIEKIVAHARSDALWSGDAGKRLSRQPVPVAVTVRRDRIDQN
jgi:Superinfection immunity protein